MRVSESPTPLILDASAAAKWFIHEPEAEKTDRLLTEVAEGRWLLMAPELLRCELAQVFWKHRGAGYSWHQARQAHRELENLGLVEVPLSALFPKTIETAYAFEISVYDAAYVTLAQGCRGTLATFDQGLLKKIRRQSRVQIYAF